MTQLQIIEKIISLWDIQLDGSPKYYDFKTLKVLVDSVDSGNATYWINLLSNQDYIRMNVYGKWSLTSKGAKLIPQSKKANVRQPLENKRDESSEINWTDFRSLLAYYIECVKAEDKREYRLKPANEGRDYFVPKRMDAGWLQSLNSLRDRKHIIIELPPSASSLGGVLRQENDGRIPCIGYPVMTTFDASGVATAYIPIAMVPVQYEDILISSTLPGAPSRYSVTLDFENATFNYEWVRDNVDNMDLKNLLEELDEDADGAFDMASGLPKILGYSSYNTWLENDYQPNILTQTLPSQNRERKRRMLCNTAVLFKMQASPFNRSLIRELTTILKASPAELDKTALAYIYRRPVLPIDTGVRTIAIPYLPSNGEQLDAVKRAFEAHLSVLQGPPGTGKSQTAVNLIANCIFRNKSVVFSSRNHAALDAIRDKSAMALGEVILPLVRYCKEEDRTIDWFTTSIDEQIQLLVQNYHQEDEANSKLIMSAIDAVSSIEQKLNEADVQKDAYLAVEADFSRKAQEIENLLIETGRSWWTAAELIDIGKRCTFINAFSNKGIKGVLFRLLNKKKYKDVLAWLSDERVISEYSLDVEADVKRFAKAFSPLLEEYLKKEKTCKRAYLDYKAGLDSSDYSTKYDNARERIDKAKYKAFFWAWTSRIKEWSQDRIDFATNGMAVAAKGRNTTDELKLVSSSCAMVHELIPAWAVSLQSASHVAPLSPGVFDYAIVDEASQCDVASIIPILYRAKNGVVIGDPEQFRPIITMSPKRHENIWSKYFHNNFSWKKFDYYSHSAFDIASYSGKKGMLKEHFRCADGIADFYNTVFYGGQLRVRTRELNLNFPAVLENKESLQWVDVKGGREAEIEEAINCFEKIYRSGYEGSIGIISPLRKTVDSIANKIYGKGFSEDDVKVNTSYGFQGGECDVIIFVVGYDDKLTKSQLFYLCDRSNRNIYNVAVSRAKACLIIVGDRSRCAGAPSPVLSSLASYPRPKEEHVVHFDSPLEKKLYDALLDRGIRTVTQYYCRGYLLDMAYEDENVKLDIEVDGSMHFGLDHIRKPRDYRRDYAVSKEGWKPMRFVSFEVIEDVEACVDKIEAEINRGKALHSQK